MATPKAQVSAGVAFGDASTADLGFLLRAAVAAPAAAQDPSAGPLIGSLLAALVERGADDVVEHHLAASASDATFEMCTYRVGSSVPVIRKAEVSGSQGIRLMLGQAEPRGGQELVAHLGDGTEARVLVRLGDGPLVYQFAEVSPSVPAVVEAMAAAPTASLADAVREALADTTIEVDLGGIEEVVARAVANALPPPAPSPPPVLPPAMQPSAPSVSEADRGGVLLERLWLKIRGISYQLRATGDALARVEAAVERVDRPATRPSERLRDVARVEIEGLRSQVAHLTAVLSGFDGAEGLVVPPVVASEGRDEPDPGRDGPRETASAPEEEGTGPVPLAIVPHDSAWR